MVEVLSQLPLLQWRDLDPPPYDLITFDWENELATRAVPYVDVDVHDNVRRKSAKFKARLYFCETVQTGAFSSLWPQWLEAIKSGDPDYLVHPLLGTLRARVTKVGGEVKAQVRDGVIVDVEWVETNEDPSTLSADLTTEIDLAAEADIADKNCSSVGISYPTGQTTKSFKEAFEGIRGSIFSLSLSLVGGIDQLMANCTAMADEVDLLNDHRAWPAYDALINCWNAASDLKDKIGSAARSTSTKKLTIDTTLDAFAEDVGNSLSEVMGLNLEALRSPIVSNGSVLKFYTSK